MAYQELLLIEGNPAFSYQSDLEGVTYSFQFTYNDRMDRWFMDISTVDGTALAVGIPLLAGVLLTQRFNSPLMPPGQMALIDTKNGTDSPTRDDLATRFQLLYRESSTADGV